MKAIAQTTCEQAWLKAAEHLAEVRDHTQYNLIVEIERPVLHEASDHRIRKTVDGFLRDYGVHPISTVAGTIFPAAEYVNHGARGVYETYPEEVYPEIRLGPSDWGRYAHRLVRWPTSSGNPINPLKTLVEKMKQQLNNGRRMRACYELSLTDSAIDLPLYDPVADGRRSRNGPCLSHVSFKIGATDILYLTALYRSHSYVSRALGNFIGLAGLQAFVCDQTGLAPGPLVSISSYARLETDAGWSVSDALQLVESARLAERG
ncbi:hypothetical protein [Corallococcus exiguus]|uniref:hypothetical protein n=1 Tax=Corallococcus exiguus TaxID=83462 RepID=UPI003DA456A3